MKFHQFQKIRKYYRFFLGVILAFWFVSLLYKPAIPEGGEIFRQIHQAPTQTDTQAAEFAYTRTGKDYWVEPVFDYKLYGLVVSKNHMKSLLDPYQRQFDARIKDFCVVWGKNATSGIMQKVKVRNSNFTCHYFSDNDQVWSDFDHEALSNNHLLANNPLVIKTLQRVEVGDQIKLGGLLANYYQDRSKKDLIRATSTTRTDTGNGACETFFVQEAEILKRSTPLRSAFFNLVQILFPWLLALWMVLWAIEFRWELKK